MCDVVALFSGRAAFGKLIGRSDCRADCLSSEFVHIFDYLLVHQRRRLREKRGLSANKISDKLPAPYHAKYYPLNCVDVNHMLRVLMDSHIIVSAPPVAHGKRLGIVWRRRQSATQSGATWRQCQVVRLCGLFDRRSLDAIRCVVGTSFSYATTGVTSRRPHLLVPNALAVTVF